MARSALTEVDLFNNAKWQSSAANPPIFERRRSFRDVTSKINPEILKNVIANVSVLSTPNETQRSLILSPLPDCAPTLGLSFGFENKAETGSMTIFYNGMVAVFDVSPHTAQNVFKLAQQSVLPKSAESSESYSYDNKNLLKTFYGDLPLARRKSLQRFLEKRKERFAMMSPYACPSTKFYSSRCHTTSSGI